MKDEAFTVLFRDERDWTPEELDCLTMTLKRPNVLRSKHDPCSLVLVGHYSFEYIASILWGHSQPFTVTLVTGRDSPELPWRPQ